MSAEVDPTRAPQVLGVSDAARAAVLETLEGERNASDLGLFVEVNGSAEGVYTYDMWFQSLSDATASDVVETHGELTVVVVETSVDKMLGAVLDVGDAGLVIVNPNSAPTPRTFTPVAPESDLSSPIERAVLHVLEHEVNPQIAAHGGRADLVAVDDNNIAYLRLSGGCQGCGMAQVTLSQGISVAIREAVPEIADIIDITSHGDGTDPYFEAAKK